MNVVAEHRIDVRYPDGQRVPVHIRVGFPYPHPQGDYACPIAADGLRIWQGPNDLFGVGSLHALIVGLRFLHGILSAEIKGGATLYWEESDQVFDVDIFLKIPIIE